LIFLTSYIKYNDFWIVTSFLSYLLIKFDPSKFQVMHFTFGINEGEKRWETLINITTALKHAENYENII
jgi:hypothetical protein